MVVGRWKKDSRLWRWMGHRQGELPADDSTGSADRPARPARIPMSDGEFINHLVFFPIAIVWLVIALVCIAIPLSPGFDPNGAIRGPWDGMPNPPPKIGERLVGLTCCLAFLSFPVLYFRSLYRQLYPAPIRDENRQFTVRTLLYAMLGAAVFLGVLTCVDRSAHRDYERELRRYQQLHPGES